MSPLIIYLSTALLSFLTLSLLSFPIFPWSFYISPFLSSFLTNVFLPLPFSLYLSCKRLPFPPFIALYPSFYHHLISFLPHPHHHLMHHYLLQPAIPNISLPFLFLLFFLLLCIPPLLFPSLLRFHPRLPHSIKSIHLTLPPLSRALLSAKPRGQRAECKHGL